jgi:hypothetical protein
MPAKRKKPKILVSHVSSDPAGLPENIIHVPNRSVNEPPRIASEVQIICDPAAVAESRRLYEQEQDELVHEAIERVGRGDWLYSDHLRALRVKADVAFQRLKGVLDDGAASPASRIKAAETLRTLGDPDGEVFWLNALASQAASLRRAALEAMRRGFPIDYRIEPWASRVLALFDDPDGNVAQAAIDLAAFLPQPGASLPDAEAKLIELLVTLPAHDRPMAALKLAEIAESLAAVKAVAQFAFPRRAKKYEWTTGQSVERL